MTISPHSESAPTPSGGALVDAASKAVDRLQSLARGSDTSRSVECRQRIAEAAAQGIESVGHALRHSDRDLPSRLPQLVEDLKHVVVELADAPLSARWFLQTQGLPARQWPGARDLRGTLGDALRVPSMQEIFDRLAPRSALVFAARAAPLRVLVIVLLRDIRGATSASQHLIALDHRASVDCLEDMDVVDGTLYLNEAAAVRRAPGDLPHRLSSLGAPQRISLHDAARRRLDALADSLLPLLRSIGGEAADIGFVPCGDLHAMPWQYYFSTHLSATLRLRLYLAASHWWRLHATPREAKSTMPRWALAAYDASDTGDLGDRLYWIKVEALLSSRLWQGAGMVPIDADDDALTASTALLACGHGFAPDGNVSRAGVWIGTSHEREPGRTGKRSFLLLDAPAMARMTAVRRVVLSCCVLGRTETVLGEPLGLMAQVFGSGSEFALGAIVHLGDLDATLFSLAFQYSLRSAYARPRGHTLVDWVDVFHHLQECLRNHRWPLGFAQWLAAELPRAMQAVVPSVAIARTADDAFHARNGWHRLLSSLGAVLGVEAPVPRASQSWLAFYELLSRTLANRPPEQLRRAAPWMVALGS